MPASSPERVSFSADIDDVTQSRDFLTQPLQTRIADHRSRVFILKSSYENQRVIYGVDRISRACGQLFDGYVYEDRRFTHE